MNSSTVDAHTTKVSFDVNTLSSVLHSSMKQSFSVTEQSLFWFQITAGKSTNNKTYYRLNGLRHPAVLFSTSSALFHGCMTADTVQWVNQSMKLSISNEECLLNNENFETSWLGFRLDDKFKPLIAFNVQLTYSLYLSDSNDPVIPFDRITTNEGNAFHVSNSKMIVPVPGLYFLAVVSTTFINVKVNEQIFLSICLCCELFSVSQERGAFMTYLNTGDEVQVVRHLIPGNNVTVFSNFEGLISFHGFLYNSIYKDPIAWSLAKVARNDFFTGGEYYVDYNVVYTNTKNVWNVNAKKVVIPVGGVFMVDFNSYLCGSDTISNDENYPAMQVQINNKTIITNRMPSVSICVGRSRSIIVILKVGDELRVTSKLGLYLADRSRIQTFNGFLIAPI